MSGRIPPLSGWGAVLPGIADERAGLVAMGRMKLRLCLACLTLAVLLPLAGLVWLVWFVLDVPRQVSCNDVAYQAVASPSGQFSAEIVTRGCDYPPDGLSAEVRLRAAGAAGAAPNGQGDTIFLFDRPPGAIKLSVAWTSEKHLVIERLCVDGYLYWALSEWPSRGLNPSSQWQPSITISYRCLDHQSEQHRPRASEG